MSRCLKNLPLIQKDYGTFISDQTLHQYSSRFGSASGKLKEILLLSEISSCLDARVLLLLRPCKRVTVLSDFRPRQKTIFTHFLHAEASETRGRLREGVRPQRGTCRLQKLKTASALHSEAPQLH